MDTGREEGEGTLSSVHISENRFLKNTLNIRFDTGIVCLHTLVGCKTELMLVKFQDNYI